MSNINKKDLVNLIYINLEQLSEESNLSKATIEMLIGEFIDVLKISLEQGKKITLTGFGSFFVKTRKELKKTHPQDPNQVLYISSKKTVRFKPSSKLNDLVN